MIHRNFLSISFLTLLLLLYAHVGTAQIRSADTTAIDTVKPAASTDSLTTPRIPIPHIGSIDRSLPPYALLTDSIINFTDYRYLGDLLSMAPGMFIRDFGTPGQWQQVTIAGVDARSVQFLSDGVPLNDSYTGQFDLYLYPTENIDRVERITGTRAFLYGFNGTGGTINLVTKSRKAIHPYSRIRYSESGYGYSFIDGMFSQDIIRGLNLAAGTFHNTFGGRFPNSDYDQWNARARLRYNISNAVNVFASEMYNHTYLGLWGGVDNSNTPTDSLFDRINASIRNSDAYEKISRHDVQAGIALRVPNDTNAISKLTFFYSRQLREYRDEENRPFSNGIFLQQDQDSRWFGARFNHQRTVGEQSLDINGEIVSRRARETPATSALQETELSVMGKAELKLGEVLIISPYARLENYLDYTRLSHGADVGTTLFNELRVMAGYSQSYRYPTLQEAGRLPKTILDVPTEYERNSLGRFPERHRLWEGMLLWNAGRCYNIEAHVFRRMIDDVIVPIWLGASSIADPNLYSFRRNKELVVRGISAASSLRFGSFVLEGEVQFLDQVNNDDPARTIPRWSGTGGIFYWDTLAGGHLNLKIGMRGHAFSSYLGREFNTLALSYVPNGQETTVDAAGTGDFFLIARLGDAYIHFIMENLFDRKYVLNTFYPITDRTLRFGVSWEFAD